MSFVRFVLTTRNPESGVEEGLFRTAYALRDDAQVPKHDRGALAEHLIWFASNLAVPDRFTRSKSKGFYRRATRGIAWFRETATECVTRMHAIKRILEEHGRPVEILCEDRIGYVVYEDEHQVIAEPFADTRTG